MHAPHARRSQPPAQSTEQRAWAGLRALRLPLLLGVVVGALQAVSPLPLWWLPAATVYALELAVIAAVYIGFSVADGRGHVIAVECVVAAAFVVVAAVGVTGSPWWLVAGMVGHAVKDWVQHRTHFVAHTRWWPPFCAAVDAVVAVALTIAIVAGFSFHS